METIKRRSEADIAVTDNIMTWLTRWAAMIENRVKRKSDGNTPYEKTMNKACRMEFVPFGEKVWYMPRDKSTNTLEAVAKEGVWLGHDARANEYWIGTKEGCVRSHGAKDAGR